jgi:hypothetical protein
MREVENKNGTKIALIVVPIVVALIGCLGVIASSIIAKIPVSTLPAFTSTPIFIIVTETPNIIFPTLALTDTPMVLPTIQVQPTIIEATPTPAPLTCKNALRNLQSYASGQTITGPATLHPFDGCSEMASQLGLVCVGYWGINIRTGQSIAIPETVTLSSGKVLQPPVGTFSSYENDNQMENTQSFWLANCK